MNIFALDPKIDASKIAPERLAKSTRLTEEQKLNEASRQFESILLKQILENSQKTVIKSKLTEDSTASGIYHDMITTQLADSISKSGTFGLTKTFENQLNRAHGARPDGLPNQKLSAELYSASNTLKPLHSTNDRTQLKSLHTEPNGQDARATNATHKFPPSNNP